MILVHLYYYCPESDERGSEWLLFSWEGDPCPWTPGPVRRVPFSEVHSWVRRERTATLRREPVPRRPLRRLARGLPGRAQVARSIPGDSTLEPGRHRRRGNVRTPLPRALGLCVPGLWEAQWLANSEGFVVGVLGGHAIARVHPEPELVRLPTIPPGPRWVAGPIPAPTGDGRYFAYGLAGVHDAAQDRWIVPGFVLSTDSQPHARREEFRNGGPVLWGETHEELRYGSGDWDSETFTEGWFGAFFDWPLLRPKLEFPPFDGELGFVVARTDGCVDLLEQPGEDALALDCLPDGTRGSLSGDARWLARPHPLSTIDDTLIRVSTEDGLEGWLPVHNLDHE